MSRPRFWWYTNVERVVLNYPNLKERKDAKQTQSVTASYSGMPRGSGASRSTENVALRQLSEREEADLYAVESAIEEVGRWQDGKEILLVIEWYYWRGFRNFDEVGYKLHMHRNTAERKHNRFIYVVAKNMGYL